MSHLIKIYAVCQFRYFLLCYLNCLSLYKTCKRYKMEIIAEKTRLKTLKKYKLFRIALFPNIAAQMTNIVKITAYHEGYKNCMRFLIGLMY